MYGPGNIGISGGSGLTTTGVAGVTLLSNTGKFRVMFIVAAVAFAVGLITLIVSAILAFKQRSKQE